MSPIHFDILEPIFRHHGYNFEVLRNDDRAIDAGLGTSTTTPAILDHGGRPAGWRP